MNAGIGCGIPVVVALVVVLVFCVAEVFGLVVLFGDAGDNGTSTIDGGDKGREASACRL